MPGDKSISQRIALLCALAKGESVIEGYLDGEDARSTLQAMEALGARSWVDDRNQLHIKGVAGQLQPTETPLDLGNSGTGTRLLAGLLAGSGIPATLIGDESLSGRPMGRIKTPLEEMGAQLELSGKKGTLPMDILGGDLTAISYEMPMASAQVKSCILLAGLFATGRTTVVEPRPTRDHTEKLFEQFGIPVKVDEHTISIEGYGPAGPTLKGTHFVVPGDFSSAAFWLVAVGARPDCQIEIERVGLNPRRTALLEVLQRMGVQIEKVDIDTSGDPVGDLRVKGAALSGTVIEGDEIPNLIDELPILAVAGALASGETHIRDARELRVKESDRIALMVAHLRSFGVEVEEFEDGMRIQGGATLTPPKQPLSFEGDHRIAMSVAILSTFSNVPLILHDVDCVDTSYPQFWADMNRLGGHVEKV
jgi:3-phosphoshikimate 1-carboxyvinyltransferase